MLIQTYALCENIQSYLSKGVQTQAFVNFYDTILNERQVRGNFLSTSLRPTVRQVCLGIKRLF